VTPQQAAAAPIKEHLYKGRKGREDGGERFSGKPR